MTDNDEQSEPREWWLNEAAWAPKGRLVAFEDEDQANHLGIHVIEYSAYEDLVDKYSATVDKHIKVVDQLVDLQDALAGLAEQHTLTLAELNELKLNARKKTD